MKFSKTVPKDTILTKCEPDEIVSDLPVVQWAKTLVLKCCRGDGVKWFFSVFVIVLIVITITSFHFRLLALEQSVREIEASGLGLFEVKEEKGKTAHYGEATTHNRVKRRTDQERHGQSRRATHSSRGGTAHSVEFLHPRTNGVEETMANNSDSVLLTSVSRIPLLAIQDFCSKTKDYCPAGTPGPIGLPGVKGERGDKGEIGPRGPQGPVGHTGPHGPRGSKGEAGRGVGGRDGLPGEPGLDGVPGRNGVDGLPGNEGIPGRDGKAGRDGIDGKKGDQGQKGDMGARGLPGLMGPIGPAGGDGIPGTHGVNTTAVVAVANSTGQLNTTILIPPSIMGSESKVRPLVVMEGETVRLGCSATGSPPPKIKWTREDENAIRIGPISYSAVEDAFLNFTKVHRKQMGRYICYADNAITPSASRAHDLHVNFGPMIEVERQQVNVVMGRPGTLECYVEAFPRGATSWQTAEGKFITSNDDKYETSVIEGSGSGMDNYRVKMTLTVKRTVKADMGLYYCIAKNTFGIVKGEVTLGEWTSSQPPPHPSFSFPTRPPGIWGKRQPDLEVEVSLCPPPPKCEDCVARIESTARCVPSGYHLMDKFAWNVNRLGSFAHPEDKNRTLTGGCSLAAVGKPVFHGEFKHNGSWMREGALVGYDFDKYFMTHMEETNKLYEYFNKTIFTNHPATYVHNSIVPHFQGNFHTIYKGNFYYVAADDDPGNPLRVIQYSVTQKRNITDISLPFSSGESAPLYAQRIPLSSSKVDLAVDENGLWAIYALPHIPNTIVVKIEVDEETGGLSIVYGWNITIGHKLAGDMWITCGVLYAIDSVTERETKIRLGIDLYRRKLLKLMDLPFTNPFQHTTMVSYNPKANQLLTVDQGNLLVYPVKLSGLLEDDH